VTALEKAGRDLDRAADVLRWYLETDGGRPDVDIQLLIRYVLCRQVYQEALRQECRKLGLGE
jgi:hypothetical protein